MKARFKASLALLSTSSLLLAQAPSVDPNDLLEDIRDALTSDYQDPGVTDSTYDNSWAYANLSAPTSKADGASGSDLSRYWSGATGFITLDSDVSDIQKTQIFLDTIVGNPYATFKKGDLSEANIKLATQNVLGGDNDTVAAEILTAVGTLKDTHENLIKAYYNLLQMEQKAKNCIAYTDASQSQRSTPRFIIAETAALAQSYFDDFEKAPECNKLVCGDSQSSQFTENQQATQITSLPQSVLTTIRQFCSNVSVDQQALCTQIKTDAARLLNGIENNGSIESVQSISSMPSLIGPVQALLAMEFHKTLKSASGESSAISFSDIYTVNSAPPSATPNPSNYLYKKGSSEPDTSARTQSLSSLVDGLSGLKTVPSPLKPGLPFYKDTDSESPTILIAGKYYTFTQDKSTNLYHSGASSGNRIWAQPNTIKDLVKLRLDSTPLYYMKRGSVQSSTTQNLMAKSATTGILNEAKDMASTKVNFGISSAYAGDTTLPPGVSKTAMAILQDGSSWRLSPQDMRAGNSWLQDIASMANAGLLRETAVLLAEMKQMMYLQLATNQKQLLMQSLINASNSPSADTYEQLTTIDADVENYAAGAKLSKLSPPEQPSPASMAGTGP